MNASVASTASAGAPAAGAAGMDLIEASAGTGKTRELTGIVASLIAKDGRRLDELLVVTFTRAATAELRERIRGALRAARRAVAAGEAGEGSQAHELLGRWREGGAFDPRAAVRRLDTALEEIDRANVLTIHGFCQRVLSELAFDGGFPFGFEVSGDDGELIARAARDYWRRRMYTASRTLAEHALANRFRPDDLAAWVRRWRAKPGLRIKGGEPPADPVEAREAEWRGVLDSVRAEWEAHGDEFRAEVLGGGWLNRSKYRAPRTETEIASIEALFAASEPGLPPEGLVGRYGAGALAAACKKGHELPRNPLFAALEGLEEACAELRAACDAWLRSARREVLAEARESIRRRVREERCLGYDDLQLELHHALRSRGGERLAERIRHEYPVALIDEFQDTDPIQAEMFMRIYGTSDVDPGSDPNGRAEVGTEGAGGLAREANGSGKHPPGPGAGRGDSAGLRVVGDPKQSIYRFRGADVFAYLRARDAARSRHSLGRNWRSVPALVEAVNAVFAGDNPFAVPAIPSPRVAAGRDDTAPLRIEGDAEGAPLRFRLLPGREDARRWNKGDASELASGAAAEEIARLLVLAENGKATIDEGSSSRPATRSLTGADIAVLVRTRAQGRRVADALRARNVASVEIGDASVFDSREAEQMERLLWALAEPGREPRERGALAGDLFGLDARCLARLVEDEDAWATWSDRLRGWRSEWAANGIGALLRRLVESEGGAARLLAYRDGARRLTNVRHLAELLQAAEVERRMAPAALAVWFSRRRAESGVRDEETELRIESDEALVRILTVHVSKGLEFPIVFLPFAWDGRDPARSRADHAVYHGSEAEGYPEVLDLEPDDAAMELARREELSEELRLLYVALTRAKYRCVVTWGRVRFAEHAPLAWLLHREGGAAGTGAGPGSGTPGGGGGGSGQDAPGTTIADAEGRFLGLGDEALHEEVRAFTAPRPDAVAATVLDASGPDGPMVLALPPPPPLAPRRLERPLQRRRQLTSFSALSAAAEAGAPASRPDVDRPDHDQNDSAAPVEEEAVPPGGDGRRTAFTFPRGAAAGSCLHRVFERLDEMAGADPDLDVVCRDSLADFGIGEAWCGVARDMVERARAVRLEERDRREAGPAPGGAGAGESTGFRLDDPVPRLVELEFAFPVAGLDRERLAAIIREGGYPEPFPPASGGAPGAPAGSPIDGYLRGFIDLVVVHEGRWYIVDYKSNWLGPSPASYAREAVAAAMGSSAYPLQYLLYLVALHRYLDLKLPGYDYDRHVGGVFYLFVRGMDPECGMERGVWFDRPAASLVNTLDRYFGGEEG